jgi:S-DNA-T family DNA segregation ATPase FtsK/SpoIIIE
MLHMSKKKKSSKKGSKKGKKADKADAPKDSGLPEGFWSQVFVICIILLSIILAFGAFGTGGAMATNLFDWARWLIGYFAYFVPLVLFFSAIRKQRDETHKLPRSTFIGILVMIAATAGFLHLFVANGEYQEAAQAGDGGGLIGYIVSSGILSILSKVTGGIALVFIAIIALHFVLKIPLTWFLRLFKIDKRKKKDDDTQDVLAPSLRVADEPAEFKLNEGVPIQKSRLSSLKNTAEKLSPSEAHEALTTTGDPNWVFPKIDLLSKKQGGADAGDVEGNAQIIKDVLGDFKIDVDMTGANIGPRVTQYTLKPPAGVKLTKITALESNLALSLAANSIRMEAPIPGQRAVGIEVPNIKSAQVGLRGILESNEWKNNNNPLGFAIGRDIAGRAVVGSLDRMPHLLIAGATGSGKSVMINTLLTSLLYRNSPADMKLILVDPKHVELTPYADIPHLLTPVIVEPERCISALKWAVAEMERRYNALSEVGKRNIAEYNKVKKAEGMPYIVIVIDELADLMMMAARDVEALIVRLAQKARAVGIHLVLATQRPSVDVITGLIKANVPGRIAFTVSQQVDSRTIIDQVGAEKLLGMGDMLMRTQEMPKPIRIQGAYIDDKEIQIITDSIRDRQAPQYDDEIISQPVQIGNGRGSTIPSDGFDADDSLYMDAVKVVVDSKKASASLLQRRLRVGYSRAARLIETMEEQGIIGPADGARPREVLIGSMADLDGDSEDEYGDL